MGYDVLTLGDWFLAFRKIMTLRFKGPAILGHVDPKDESTRAFRNVGNQASRDKVTTVLTTHCLVGFS